MNASQSLSGSPQSSTIPLTVRLYCPVDYNHVLPDFTRCWTRDSNLCPWKQIKIWTTL